jgi:hypothetical protein
VGIDPKSKIHFPPIFCPTSIEEFSRTFIRKPEIEVHVEKARMNYKQLGAHMLIVLFILLAVAPITLSQPQLAITVATEKHDYHYRQLVKIYGNVTYQGALVADGLVAIQTTFPHSLEGHNVTRTVPANATPTEDWVIEVTSIITTDSNGNPQTTFSNGGYAWFEVNIKNNADFGNKTVLYTLTLCDSDSTPFKFHWVRLIISAGANFTERVRLDLNGYDGGTWVSTGSAKAYANVYTNFPSMGGYPYSPEKSATFTITSTSMQTTTAKTTDTQTASSYNSYHAAIRIPPNVPLGTYNITVSAYYRGFKDTYTTVTFDREYEMRGDVIFNHKIDIFDIVAVATAYGKKGGLPRWNPEADLDANGKVDIFDVVKVATNYGKVY